MTHTVNPSPASVDWFKSSYSEGSGNACLEVASLDHQVGIRDSKDKQGPALVVPSPAWAQFVAFAAR